MENADDSRFSYDIEGYSGSDKSLELACNWVKTCVDSHAVCRDEPSSRSNGIEPAYTAGDWYPTRLLYVGSTGDNEIRLISSQNTELEGPYITLSHCWGGVVPLRLLVSNKPELERSILPNSLPRTFADAVKVTRRLGVRYLWIDSLCIIQDSPDDWNHEALQMCNVYRRSLLCIAAGAAHNSNEGLFRERLPSACIDSEVIETYWSGSTLRRYRVMDRDFWRKNVAKSHINQRAWVLQERLLSPRTLRFNSLQVFWECQTIAKCESFPRGIPHAGTTGDTLDWPGSLTTRGILRGIKNSTLHDLYVVWHEVVMEYSSAALTKPGDKLVAISGLAKAMQPLLDDKYVAGMWRRSLEASILWRARNRGEGESLIPKSEEYRAPSWSWAANDCPLWLEKPVDGQYLIKIHDYAVANKFGDAFGTVSGAHLTLSGVLHPVILHKMLGRSTCWPIDWETAVTEGLKDTKKQEPWKLRGFKYWTYMKHVLRVWTNKTVGIATYMDYPTEEEEFVVFLLPVEQTEWKIRGLILQPVEEKAEQGVYKRTGMFEKGDDFEFLLSNPAMTPARRLLYKDEEAKVLSLI